MHPWIAAATLLGALVVAPSSETDPPRYDPKQPALQDDALGLLRHGPEFLEDVELPGDPWSSKASFRKIDAPLASFLKYPHMQPAVQFSCAVMVTPGEARLTKALQGRNDARALLALAALLHVHAPGTVAEQLGTLERLEKARPKWKATLAELSRAFDEKAIGDAIAQDPPADERYGQVPELEWAIRVVGVRKQASALPRLAELCVHDHLHTSLTAERSIEDFVGAEADAALATCVEGWQYNAADRAFDALHDRNPGLARKTLVGMPVPSKDELRRYASALARVAGPSAVPRIIELIPDLDDPLSSIVALETFAEPTHHAAIGALVPLVEALHQDRLRVLADRLSR